MSTPKADPDIGDVFDQLEELANTVDSDEERQQVEKAMELTVDATEGDGDSDT